LEFCPKCDAMLVPKKENGKSYLICRKCNFKKEIKGEEYKLSVKIPHTDKEKIAVIEGESRIKISEEEREAFEDYYRGGEGEIEESDLESDYE